MSLFAKCKLGIVGVSVLSVKLCMSMVSQSLYGGLVLQLVTVSKQTTNINKELFQRGRSFTNFKSSDNIL